MEKLPYFKFNIEAWVMGEISRESHELKGIFVDLCAYYWSNECYAELKKSSRWIRANESQIIKLSEIDIIGISDEDIITISFLDSQLKERLKLSSVRKESGSTEKKKKKTKSPQAYKSKRVTEQKANAYLGESKSLIDDKQTETVCSTLREEKRRKEKIREDIKTQDKKDGVGFPFLQILMDGYPKPFNKFDDEVLRAIQQALSVEPDTAVIVSGMAEYKTHLTAIDLPMQKITRVGKWLNEGHWTLNYQDETRRILAEKSSRLPAKPSNVLDLDKMDYSGEF